MKKRKMSHAEEIQIIYAAEVEIRCISTHMCGFLQQHFSNLCVVGEGANM